MITRETDYAIRTVQGLAQAHRERRLISAAVLAKDLDIPYRFLRNVCRRLVKAGLVRSRRGAGGGLALTAAPAKLSLLQVMRALDPRSAILNRCLLEDGCCSRESICRVHRELARLQRQLDRGLAAVRFNALR